MRRISIRLFAGMLVTAVASSAALAQNDGPTKATVEEIWTQFKGERKHLTTTGAVKRFLPGLLKKADQMAARGIAALKNGRLLQASELLRQARWQLPYQSTQVPKQHVAKVLGNVRLRHSGPVYDAQFSPDGQRLATAGADRTVAIWDMANGHRLTAYTGHSDYVRHIAFGPNGKLMASAGGDATVHIWDTTDGKQIRTIKSGGQYVKDLAVTPDGKYVVIANNDQAVRIFDINSGDLKRDIRDFKQDAQCLTFTAKGDILAVGVGDGMMRLWEYPRVVDNVNSPAYWSRQDPTGATHGIAFSPDGKTMARLSAVGIKLYDTPKPDSSIIVTDPRFMIKRLDVGNEFVCATFRHDGKILFTATKDGVIRKWDVQNGRSQGVMTGHEKTVNALALNAGGNRLASASDDYTVRIWDFNIVLESRGLTGHKGPIWSAAFNPDGQTIVSAGADKTAMLWDVASGTVIRKLDKHESPLTTTLFSPDGKTVITAGGEAIISIWNAADGALIKSLRGHTGTITALAINHEGTRIVSGSVDHTIRVWDVASGKELVSANAGAVVMAVALHPNGKQMASGDVDQTIRLWDAQTGAAQHAWTAHGVAVTSLAYSPDGQWLASTGADHIAHVWSVKSPSSEPITLSGHTGPLSSVAFRKDSMHLATAGSDRVVKLWKIEKGDAREAQTFRGHTDWVTSVAFSKDGHYIVSASTDRTLRLWELTSREIPLQAEHTGSVLAVAVSPDGTMIASAGSDRTIKLWDRETGTKLRTMYGHSDAIIDLAFSRDGKMLLSSSNDRSIKRWDVNLGQEILFAKGQGALFSGLIQPAPLLQVVPDNQHVNMWILGNERYTTIARHEMKTSFEKYSTNIPKFHFTCVAFSSDGQRAILGAKKGSAFFVNTAKDAQQIGQEFHAFRDEAITAVALSVDGTTAVIGNEKGTLMVVQPTKWTVRHTIKATKYPIYLAAISPDEKRFAIVSHDNIVRLWDVASGKLLRSWDMNAPMQYGRGFVADLAFTPDSQQLVTANANTTVYVLELP